VLEPDCHDPSKSLRSHNANSATQQEKRGCEVASEHVLPLVVGVVGDALALKHERAGGMDEDADVVPGSDIHQLLDVLGAFNIGAHGDGAHTVGGLHPLDQCAGALLTAAVIQNQVVPGCGQTISKGDGEAARTAGDERGCRHCGSHLHLFTASIAKRWRLRQLSACANRRESYRVRCGHSLYGGRGGATGRFCEARMVAALSSDEAWYARTASEVLVVLGSGPHGLAEADARRRLADFGENRLAAVRRPSLITMFFDQFRNFMVLVLLAATLISGLLGEYSDAITIVVIVVANALLGCLQQWKAEQSLQSLRELSSPSARVLRDDAWHQVPAQLVVPGDVIELTAGDRVPADSRLLTARNLQADEASLTGESVPVLKDARVQCSPDAPLAERSNMVYVGSAIVRGRATAVVTATGMATEMGQIARLIESSEQAPTPLELRLEQLGRVLVYVSLIITAIVVAAGILHGHAVYEMFLAGVSLAVAAIPEGLPAIVTIALALGVQRMIKRHAIVRRLPAVETLGCATVICSDKTGTLTQNQMTVKELVVAGQRYHVTGDGYTVTGRLLRDGVPVAMNGAVKRAIEVGLHCNTAVLRESAQGVETFGDPTEIALLALAKKMNVERLGPTTAENPFDSDRKRMAVVVDAGEQVLMYVKGAPDALLQICSHCDDGAGVRPLCASDREQIRTAIDEMAGRALRTLGLAYRRAATTEQCPTSAERDLVWCGVAGIVDPPRAEAMEAIRTCRRAGVRTILITGDHPLTAMAVARELGIAAADATAITGRDLDALNEDELAAAAAHANVYARVSPAHKLRVVRALARQGHVVAMTGDGVNDAPAIRAADIGIAMGRQGTEVAKDAADLVLADDNFATIVAAIEEGRHIYDNIRKFIRYLLASNCGEIVTMFLAMAIGLPLPLLPIQILWVNLVTDGLPAIALGVDSAEEDTMQRPPRGVREGIFARGLGRRILTRGLLIGLVTLTVFYVDWKLFGQLQTARTMAFATLVAAQLIHVFDCRSVAHGVLERGIFGNKWLIAAVLSSCCLLLVVIYVPDLSRVFHTSALSLGEWLAVIAGAAVPTFAVTARRTSRQRLRRARKA